jgi:hypothetical protein
MSMNRIQFHPTLSRLRFVKLFDTEVQCEADLERRLDVDC